MRPLFAATLIALLPIFSHAAKPDEVPKRLFHPAVTNSQVWPGPEGYPWKDTGQRLWTREGLVRRFAPNHLICTWTTGGATEPRAGNHTMYAISDDNGKTWSPPAILFRHPTRGLFTTELFIPKDNEIHAFLQTYGNNEWMSHLQSFRAISRDGAKTWEGPHSIPGGIDNVWMAGGIKHSTGRWIFPMSWVELIGEEWSPPHVGNPPSFGQVGSRVLKQAIIPFGAETSIEQSTGNAWCDANNRYAVGVILSDDNGASFQRHGYITGGLHGWLIEPRIIELSNGHIAMLIRSQKDGFLWRSDSTDRGQTWSPAIKTDIPNPSSKINLQRAKDGRIFLIHNPVNSLGEVVRGRNPLSLWISNDDMKTWAVKVDLVKDPNPRAGVQYPDGFLDEQQNMLILAWEDGKRVYLMRVPMDIH